MGMDLRLIPLDDRREVILKATGRIQPAIVHVFANNAGNVAEQLHQIKDRPKPRIIPEQFARYILFSWMGEHFSTDRYWHEPLQFVSAKQLKQLEVGDDPRDLEIMASIAELWPDTRVLVWWAGTPD
jgi:hypothetical protein